MGFYGNITNTSKTTFAFDKIYSNRYEAELGCASDGIMIGRYILVEYDHNPMEGGVQSQKPLYCYDGQIYETVIRSSLTDGTKIIIGPQLKYEDENNGIPKKGEIVKIDPGNQAGSVNKTPLFIQITDADDNFRYVTEAAFNSYNDSTFEKVNITRAAYKTNYYYLRKETFNNQTNQVEVTHELDKEFPEVQSSLLTTENLYKYADVGQQTATCRDDDVWWVYVEDDRKYMPIGHIRNMVVDGESVREWWEANERRKNFRAEVTTPAMMHKYVYYTKSVYKSNIEYYLPWSQIFREVAQKDITEFTYAPGTYYFLPRLESNNESESNQPITYLDKYELDESENITPGRRYFVNGRLGDVYIQGDKICIMETSIEDDPDNVISTDRTGQFLRVNPGHSYSTNSVAKFWVYNGSVWNEISITESYVGASSASANYLNNFAIDMAHYENGRGYDSTAWQKVFSEGVEKYVMVAELNSVVPTFDITADAPTLTPLMPHFDNDSTNVYYKLHWQPQWGFRVKGADNSLKVPAYNPEGKETGSIKINARRQYQDNDNGMENEFHTYDNVYYPSDEDVAWKATHYDASTGRLTAGYYNKKDADWSSDEPTTIPAAIYYNKAGFNPKEVAYSEDLITEGAPGYNEDYVVSGWKNEDKIAVTPTGQSGNIYTMHDGTYDASASEDTQEFSLMLPSLGDTIAKVWDTIFGGRETNAEIAETGERNLDISWEEGRASLDRRGLRLVHDVYDHGHKANTYSKSEVDTVAGAINSAHDILGMIIQEDDEATLMAHIDNLEDEKIYYDKTNQKYVRRHLTYDYTPVDVHNLSSQNYVAATVTEDTYDPAVLWIVQGGQHVHPAENAPFNPGQQYYVLSLDVYEHIGLQDFVEDTYYFMSKTNTIHDSEDPIDPTLMNYTQTNSFLPGHDYCKIDLTKLQYHPLNKRYKANTYYVRKDGGFVLDENESASSVQYYTINQNRIVKVLDYYDNIYVPNYYYYIDVDANGIKTVHVDGNSLMTTGRNYYLLDPQANEDSGNVDDSQYIERVYMKVSTPLDQDDFEANVNSGYYFTITETETAGASVTIDGVIYTKYNATWAAYSTTRPTLYIRETVYEQVQGQQTVTIEMLENMDPLHLIQFSTGIFFVEKKDNDDNVIGYTALARDKINPNQPKKWVAFGYGRKGIGEYYKFADPSNPFRLTVNVDNIDVISDKAALSEWWAVGKLNDFYVPGMYHFMDEEGNLILDTYPSMTRDDYFTIPLSALDFDNNFDYLNTAFYEPFKYYRETIYGFEKAKEEKPIDNNYYERKQLYVVEDTSGVFPKGTPWPSNVFDVPTTVTLGTRTERRELKELPGFARDVNTMHGMLLKLNRFMEYDDTLTRDERIANGLLNKLNDVIFGLERLVPRQFFIVDDLGKAHSTDWDTRQANSFNKTKSASKPLLKDITGDKFAQADTVETMRNQWISVNIDGSVVDKNGNAKAPLMTIHHNFQAVKNDPVSSDMNGNGDTVELYVPIVDAMGHVVGNKNNTVTLPYGFKTVTPGATSNAVADIVANTTAIIATNTQDGVTFTPGNKWLHVAASGKTFTIAHAVPGLTAGAANTGYGASMTDKFLFKVPTLTVDEAGHTTAIGSYDITLPENFKTISTTLSSVTTFTATHATGSVSPATLTDTLILAEGNRWINIITDATNKKFTFEHAAAGTASTSKGDTTAQTPNFGATFKVLSAGIDQAGHVASLEEHDVTIPLPSLVNGTGQVVTGLSLTASTGAFTETKADLGTILMTGYTLGTDTSKVAATDSLNTALSKLQAQVNKEVEDREDAIENLVLEEQEATTGQVIEKISQTDGVVAVSFRDLTKEDIPTIDNSQVDGLGDFATMDDSFEFTDVDDTTINITLAQAIQKISELTKTVKDLQDIVDALYPAEDRTY